MAGERKIRVLSVAVAVLAVILGLGPAAGASSRAGDSVAAVAGRVIGGAPGLVSRAASAGWSSAVRDAASTAQGQAIVNAAAAEKGYHYCWDGGNTSGPTHGDGNGGGEASDCGNTSTVGFDCSGLTLYAVYRGTGGAVSLPHNSAEQASPSVVSKHGGTVISSEAALEPGDLLFFRERGSSAISHTAVYAGSGKIWDSDTAFTGHPDGVYEVPITDETTGPDPLVFVEGVRYWKNSSHPAVAEAVSPKGVRYIDLFATASNGTVVSEHWDSGANAWSAAFTVPGGITAAPGTSPAVAEAVSAKGVRYVDLFTMASNGTVISEHWDSGASAWSSAFTVPGGI